MKIEDRIDNYWSLRAEEFSHARMQDLRSGQRKLWEDTIRTYLPAKENIRALDLGTGAGFYAFLLNELGCSTVGIDFSQKMIQESKKTGNC